MTETKIYQKHTGNAKHFVIPEGVTEIGSSAFSGCINLQSVVIPESVSKIGDEAFQYCRSLTSIVIPDGVEINKNMFFGTPYLKNIPGDFQIINAQLLSYRGKENNISIPEGVTRIGDYAFYGCSDLVSVMIPEGVTEIGKEAFRDCSSLQSVVLPESVASIGYGAFGGCKSLTSIVIPDGVEINKSMFSDTPFLESIPGDFQIINSQLLSYRGKDNNISIPEAVTRISDYAFDGCSSLQSVVIPEGVTEIGRGSFYRCSSLQSVVISESVTEIGNSAFSECKRLQSVVIPEGVTSISDNAFQWCSSLQSVVIPESVAKIGRYAFYSCSSLQSVVIPEGVTSISDNAFQWCSSLQSVVIPESVTSIGYGAFSSCSNLQSVVISEGVTEIGGGTFSECSSLQSVVIPEGVTEIGKEAFRDCSSLQSVVIPESVTSIGGGAFSSCKSLTSIMIPEGVTSIGYGAFSSCESLTTIVIPDGVEIEKNMFSDTPFLESIPGDFQIINSKLLRYRGNGNNISIPEGVTRIGVDAFSHCSSLHTVVISEGVTSIGDGAFKYCKSLTSIFIPEGVTEIAESAFHYCSSLQSVVIPEGVTAIGENAFYDCSSLQSVVISEGVTAIGAHAFYGCRSLQSVEIPEGVTEIGSFAFSGCSSLQSVVIPEGVTSIGYFAFSSCNSLTSIVIPEGVTSIGYFAFSSCESLTSIVIRKGVTSIGNGVFSSCSSLQSVVISEGVTEIGEGEFRGCSSLQSVVIPEGMIRIGEGAFSDCKKLISIVLPKSITNIGKDAFTGCIALKEIQNIISLIQNGCKVHTVTLIWLLENIWNGPEFLSEIAQAYFISSAKTVDAICETRLLKNIKAATNVILELIEVNKGNASALKKIATFALMCGEELPRKKLIAIYEALQKIGAKPAVRLLETTIKSDDAIKLEGGTGHPIELVCLNRYNEVFMDKWLKDYGISPQLFESIHYKGSKTLTPAFVLKCVVFPYMQQLKELPKNIGDYHSDFIQVELEGQIDEIADTLEREELQQLLERIISTCDPLEQPRLLLPYCRYGSGKQMNALAALGKKWTDWEKYLARGRRNNIVIRGAMLLNDCREAMFLVEKWGLLDEYAKLRNTTADVLRDTVLTEFDLDTDGSKRYDLGNTVIAASIMQDLSVSLFNETDRKGVKSLPKKGADPEKYAAAAEDFADLKKNIKSAVKNRVEQLKDDFVSGRELKASDWKASYLNNYVLKRVASLLVWLWRQENSSRRFMLTMDNTFIGCDGLPVEVSDVGLIAVTHPVEIPAEELDCWKTLLTEKQLAQPFVQMFEPVCDIDPSAAAARYKDIELPIFLLRGLAKEGIYNTDFWYEGGFLDYQGKAITIQASVSGAHFTERSIPFDEIVKLEMVTIKGTPRAVNHEVYAMDKALIENRVRNGDIAAVQAFSSTITAKTIQHLIDVSFQVEQMEVTAWLMNYKNDHFPYTFADLEL